MDRRGFLKLIGAATAAAAVGAVTSAPMPQKSGMVVDTFRSDFGLVGGAYEDYPPGEDLIDTISMIDPLETPMLDMLKTAHRNGKLSHVNFDWLEDDLWST